MIELYDKLFLYYGDKENVTGILRETANLRDIWTYNSLCDLNKGDTVVSNLIDTPYEIDKCRYQAIQFSPLADYLDIDNNLNIFQDRERLLGIFKDEGALNIIRLLYNKGQRLVLDDIERYFGEDVLNIVYETIRLLLPTYKNVHLSANNYIALGLSHNMKDKIDIWFCCYKYNRGYEDTEPVLSDVWSAERFITERRNIKVQ